jgi:rhodanese-related sulfurtransferase
MSNFSTITSDQLQEKLESDDSFLLVDTLGDQSYQRAHLPQAVSISAKEDEFADRVAEAVNDKHQEIIVYCGSFDCGLSSQAAEDLTAAEFSNVVDYEGGLKDWAESGYNLEGEEAQEVQTELAEN